VNPRRPSRLAWLLLPALLLALASVPAQDAQEVPASPEAPLDSAWRAAAEGVSTDLRAALDELAALREAIAAEKPELARETNRIAAELREARRQGELATTRKDAAEADSERRERELRAWREEKHYLEGILFETRRSAAALLHPARRPDPADPPPASGESPTGPARELAALESALDELEPLFGLLDGAGAVASLTGSALAPDGRLLEGAFAEAGPVSWFLSDDGAVSGLAETRGGALPRLAEGTADPAAIRRLLEGDSASPVFDPTLGSAVAIAQSRPSLLVRVREGGFWIYPILLLALVALVAALAKWWQLLKIRALPAATVQEVIDALNRGEPGAAREALAGTRHPAARLLQRGVALVESAPGKANPPSRDDLEEALFESFLAEQPRLQQGLPFIAIAAATAPLLGLLGTVTGMIETFRLINLFGTGDAKSLASGISEALVTTEFGLVVAIPSLILHALLSRKTQGIKAAMEMTSLAFLNGVRLPSQARSQPSALPGIDARPSV